MTKQRGRKPLSPWFDAYTQAPEGGTGVYEMRLTRWGVMRARFVAGKWYTADTGVWFPILPGDKFRGLRAPAKGQA